MIKQIKNLSKLQLQNLYGLNVLRHTKDPKAKKNGIRMAVVCVVIIGMLMAYVAGIVVGLSMIGLANLVPSILIMTATLIIFMFVIFKAGNIIFQKNAYDIVCSLPVPQSAIVVSRFVRMYVENLMMVFLIFLPGLVTYGILEKPGIGFYVSGIVITFFVPLAPLTVATFIGAVITGISARMRHKNLVSTMLSVALIVGVLLASGKTVELEGEITVEMLQSLANILEESVASVYPPAVSFANAMINANYGPAVLWILLFVAMFAAMIFLVSIKFHSICQKLFVTNAKHNYQMSNLKKNSILGALLRKEMKRYFSSSIYVTNTIVGAILGLVFAGAICFGDIEKVEQSLGLPISITGIIPCILAICFSIMTTTCTSVSMEGKEWWILKSLPVKTRDIMNAKVLLNLVVDLPFLAVAEILLIIARRPAGIEWIWYLLLPICMITFACVFGLTVNLKMPVFNWENEVVVVKQSASTLIGGLGGGLIVVLCTVAIAVVPAAYGDIVKAVVCVLLAVATAILYNKNSNVNLQDL